MLRNELIKHLRYATRRAPFIEDGSVGPRLTREDGSCGTVRVVLGKTDKPRRTASAEEMGGIKLPIGCLASELAFQIGSILARQFAPPSARQFRGPCADREFRAAAPALETV